MSRILNQLNLKQQTSRTDLFYAQVEEWNIMFPFDRIWRKKHNVPFGCYRHKEMNFIDMVFDLFEDKIFKDLANERERKEFDSKFDSVTDSIFSNRRQAEMKMSENEIDEAFDNLDIDKLYSK